ncbi:MAG TPA: tetratricopeptide repeat protein [Candidatus Polarisedimenticolaceae bacterium]|nr:tetratricopeptide repeat protein [Candidatus Polarisedimenticolaceae bacterium]
MLASMDGLAKNALLIVALLAVVIAGSYFYSRSIGPDRTATPMPATETPARPEILVGTPVHAQLKVGLDLRDQGRLDQAVAALEQVPADDAGYLVALESIGSIRMRLGDWDGARRAFEELCTIQVTTRDLLANIAWVNFRLEDYDGAELAALRALEIEPDDDELRYDVGLFRVARGELAEAIGTYERAILRNSDRETILHGLTGLSTLHELHPDIPGTHYALAYFARRLSRDEMEVEELRHYLASNPAGPTADFARSRLDALGG